MFKKLLIISASVLISLSALGYGVYRIGNAAYDDGVKSGISAVVHQCAQNHTTIYNGETGEVMVCDGGHLGETEKTPEKGLPEAPSPIQPPAGQPGFFGDPREQSV